MIMIFLFEAMAITWITTERDHGTLKVAFKHNENYNKAISLFKFSNRLKINEDIFAISTYWLADCYYNIADFKRSAELYNEYLLVSLSSTINFAQYNLGYAYFNQKDYILMCWL